jgi:hypothetical protein
MGRPHTLRTDVFVGEKQHNRSVPFPQPTVHVAIPVQDEVEYLTDCIDALRRQDGVRFVTWFCVNQPEVWQQAPDQRAACEANQICLRLLRAITDLDIRIIDRASRGRGWPPKRGGVGQARKELMDAICAEADPHDLIVSLDADTLAPPHYLQSLVAAFARHPAACGISARYFHPLTEDEAVTRAMLGYEIYMRFYALNLWRIESPYSFTALGSAIALPAHVYRQVGGLTPRSSSEDFYFLQKLTKHGRVLHWTDAPVAPATRKSWRVPVGTGQAIVAACEGKYSDRYPLYPPELFDRVRRTTEAFPDLFVDSVETPLDVFLREKTNTDDPWQPLRENHKTLKRFVRACHQRLDGLRILQYLKAEYRRVPSDDRATLIDWLGRHGSALPGNEAEASRWRAVLEERPLTDLSTPELDAIRRMLFRMEDGYRKEDDLDG